MPKNLAYDSATGGLCVTLTSQVVVYAPAERAYHWERYTSEGEGDMENTGRGNTIEIDTLE